MKNLLAIALALLAGCTKKGPCGDEAKVVVRVSDAKDAAQLAIKRDPVAPRFALCDASAHQTGSITENGAALVVSDDKGAPVLTLADDAQGTLATEAGGRQLRITRQPSGLRINDGDGNLIAAIATAAGTSATIISSGGVANVAPNGPAVEIRDKGVVRMKVYPPQAPVAVALLGVSALPVPERALLYVWATKTSPSRP